MLEIGYGHTLTSINDDYIRMVNSALEGFSVAGNPGSMLVDFFPPCESRIALSCPHSVLTIWTVRYLPAWFPGLTWKEAVTRLRPDIDNMNLRPFRAVINAVVRNTTFAMSVPRCLTPIQNSGSDLAKSSFATEILGEVSLDEPISPAEEREMSGAVGTLYTGTHYCTPPLLNDSTIGYSWNRYRTGHREYDRVRG